MMLAATGSRMGMNKHQERVVIELLGRLKPTTLLHGACTGVDTQMVELVDEYYPNWSNKRPWIVAYPGVSTANNDRSCQSKRALELSDEVMPERGHFSRNRTMVELCEILLAVTYYQPHEEPEYGSGGGTFFTIQHGEKLVKPHYICWANGEVTPRCFSS